MTQTWALQVGNLPPNGGSGWRRTFRGGSGSDERRDRLARLGDDDGRRQGDVAESGPRARIGVDVDGYIWAVILGGTVAYRIHPETFEIAEYNGLNQPYTYSDMAGGQINNVTCNPQG